MCQKTIMNYIAEHSSEMVWFTETYKICRITQSQVNRIIKLNIIIKNQTLRANNRGLTDVSPLEVNDLRKVTKNNLGGPLQQLHTKAKQFIDSWTIITCCFSGR